MVRYASAIEQIDATLLSMKLATSTDELRIAQAVLLALTLHETAQAIGRSVGATCLLTS
jgi:hypothetical protein